MLDRKLCCFGASSATPANVAGYVYRHLADHLHRLGIGERVCEAANRTGRRIMGRRGVVAHASRTSTAGYRAIGLPFAAVIALAVIALVARQAHAQEPSAPGPQAFKPEFSPGACPERLNVPHDAFLRCGYVTVLEDRAKPDGRTIELYVVRIRALSPIRHPDPVIYLAGGPGGSATRGTQGFLDLGRHLWTGRYLVLFDQRGIGRSKPRLECAQFRHDYADIRDRDLDPDEELEWSVEALLDCKGTLTDQGIDLGAYTSASTAADVADIVSAMDFDSFNLYGASYGTLLALTVMRDFPAGVRSVILDGVLPLQISWYETYYAEWAAAVDRFFRHCEADPVCSRQHPNLEETFWRAVDRYTAGPFTLEYYDRYADEYVEEEFDGDFVARRLVTSLRSHRWIPYLPLLVSEIAAGNDFVADAWARPVSWDDSEPIDNTAARASMVVLLLMARFSTTPRSRRIVRPTRDSSTRKTGTLHPPSATGGTTVPPIRSRTRAW